MKQTVLEKDNICENDCHDHSHEHKHGHHHGCACSCSGHDDHDDDDDEEEISLKKIIIAALIFGAALLIQNSISWILSFVPEKYFKDAAHIQQSVPVLIVRGTYLVLYAVSYMMTGLGLLKEAAENIKEGNWFGEEFLMSIATLGAIFMGEYSEACAVMILFQAGEYLEHKAVGRSKKSISDLMGIKVETVRVLDNGKEVQKKTEEIAAGDIIVIHPGERIPLDGTVIKGSAGLDTSALTGESALRTVTEGQEVMSGTVCTDSVLQVRVTKVLEESTVTRILNLVEEAQEKKAVSERFIRRFAKVYTPIVCIIAVAVAVIPPAILGGTSENWHTWIYRALELLVVSCPCALVISVPLSFFSGIGLASRHGILIKGSMGIEKLSRVKTIVFDKTGTLTKGVLEVSEVIPASDKISSDELLALACHAEYFSEHPVSKSIKKSHSCPMCGKNEILNPEEISGHGIRCVLDGRRVLAGNELLMEKEKVSGFVKYSGSEGTVIYVASEGEFLGAIAFADSPKEESLELVSRLKKAGVRHVAMFTGDNEAAASRIARQCNVDEYYSSMLPQDKVQKLEELLERNKKLYGKNACTAFTGDGINDAPVLTRSDIGISMGTLGSDSAVEASDVVIMDDSLSHIPQGIRIAGRTMRNVIQNTAFSISVKTAIMALCISGMAGMWLAVFGDVGVTLLAVLNSFRLSRSRIR